MRMTIANNIAMINLYGKGDGKCYQGVHFKRVICDIAGNVNRFWDACGKFEEEAEVK